MRSDDDSRFGEQVSPVSAADGRHIEAGEDEGSYPLMVPGHPEPPGWPSLLSGRFGPGLGRLDPPGLASLLGEMRRPRGVAQPLPLVAGGQVQ